MTVFAAAVPGIDSPPPRDDAARRALIEKTLDEIRPRLVRDGGDLALVAIRGRDVYVKMSGACAHCQLAAITLGGIQHRLMTALKTVVRVLPADLLEDDA
ncbi:Nitrogen fixation protein NifU (fragment) [uncultured Alphaproteobacteria bacterium]|uniref:Nitrogen fixation protein NifU n=1 Tax=uncultured Alphaproteobacteria bacterium TaxID=91750 RepID=A0A212K4R8_9PROT